MAMPTILETYAPDKADEAFIARIVASGVMADLLNHNVVNGHKSASAAAPADATATPIQTTSALSGYQANTTQLQDAALSSLGKAADIGTSNDSFDVGMDGSAADPSAGNAATLAVNGTDVPNGATFSTLQDSDANATAGDVVPNELVADDGSVNSDTDVSRADGSEARKDETSQQKGSLVKKPATFSKVSVTKTFLAKATIPQPTTAKIGQKPSSTSVSAQPVPRPRLVAKTGSSLQNAQKAGLGAASTSGPDASKVWNKNRPVAPIPPKQLTDEQLKQQYGIHLATRLQTNEGGKDSTWADIDDDDDDWAPETVTWVDGTKSSLTPAEAPAAPPAPAKTASPAPPAKNPDAPKPTLVARRAAESTAPKTILKPGIALQQAKQQQTSTVSSEKPSLKGKSPAPAPTKSPWATVPPVEAVSPINPPVQQAPASVAIAQVLPPQDARAYEPAMPSQPAREIAADTFDRSDLGTRPEGASRELFNSSNGRYEPAPERRSSLRPERKTAVLQRPLQGGSSPTEGSTSRGSAQPSGLWTRRRGSSVSQDVRESSKESQTSNTASVSVDAAAGQPDGSHPSFAQKSPWDSQMPQRPEVTDQAPPAEDPVKVQERIMREKREMAIRRRKEQEDREEAERKERLQAKLDALAGAGKSRKEREAEAAERKAEPATTAASSATVEDIRAIPTASALQTDSAQPQPKSNPQEKLSLSQEAQKISDSAVVNVGPSVPQQATVNSTSADGASQTTDQAQADSRAQHSSPVIAGRGGFSQPSVPYKASGNAYQAPTDSKPPAFGRSPLTNNDPFSPWGTTPSNGNIWGSSGMGNGTFEKSSAFSPMPLQTTSGLPPPLGMSLPGSARISPEVQAQEMASANNTRTQSAEPLRNFPPGIDARADNNWGAARPAGAGQNNGVTRLPHGPGPIAPPSRAHAQQPQSAAGVNPRANSAATWNRAAQTLPYKYGNDVQPGEASPPEPKAAPSTTIKETFRKTTRAPILGGRRQYESTEYTVHDARLAHGVSSQSPAPPSAQTQPSGPFSASSTADVVPRSKGDATTLAPIGPPHRAVLSNSPANVNFPTAPLPSILENRDASQPPPETGSHPVYHTGTPQPTVKLPKAAPVVKLPPAYAREAASTPTAANQRPYATWGHPGATRPIAQTPDWQARFNGLFNRTPIHTEVPPSPPGTPPKMQGVSLAVTSSSKALLVDPARVPAATVSLPPSKRTGWPVTVLGFDQDMSTKPSIEPSFNEELKFGSLPRVNIPRSPRYRASFSSKGDLDVLKHRLQAQLDVDMKAQSVAGELYFYKAPQGYYLRLPGTKLNNVLIRHSAETARPTGPGDRKHSGRQSRGNTKARDSTRPAAVGKTVTATPPAAVFQKLQSSPPPSSAPAVVQTPTKKKSNWLKPKKSSGSPPVKT